jgi:hypothetical protein
LLNVMPMRWRSWQKQREAVACGLSCPAPEGGSAQCPTPGLTPGNPNTLFSETYSMETDTSSTFTLSGIGSVTAGAQLSVICEGENAGTLLTVESGKWYVAPVQTN